MNFFEAQDRSRRVTRRLIALYALATLVIVLLITSVAAVLLSQSWSPTGPGLSLSWLQANALSLAGVAGSTAGFIGLSSAYKIARLSGGGSRVALDMGGSVVSSDVQDPLRKRLRNVVEEMSIASGLPVPEIYVLEEEMAINAFAAGYSPEDAAVAVTRGALETLDRDELQGVIAHEFSHILNGDMRLNIRLMGVLFGILAIGLIGRMILRSSRHSRFMRSSRDNKGAAVGLLIGLALFIIGYIGVFFGRLIKAGVSRQREFLADASAVQFTRQTKGIAGALKKIGGFSQGSRMGAADSEEISHMLFALGSKRMSGLLATHPPLEERIKALDASFDTSQYVRSSSTPFSHKTSAVTETITGNAAISGFAQADAADTESWLTHSGQPLEEHIAFAGQLRRSVPELLLSAAHSKDQSSLLAIALILDVDDLERERQIAFLNTRLGELRARRIGDLYDEFSNMGPRYRLPLLDIAFPALKDRPMAQIEFLIDLVDQLIVMDGKVDLTEYAFARVLQSQLRDALSPRRLISGTKTLAKSRSALTAANTLLCVVASHGDEPEQGRLEAYRAGLEKLPIKPDAREKLGRALRTPADWVNASDQAMRTLNQLNARGKRQVLEALIAVGAHDHGLNNSEAEMLRAIAAVLQCPLTPLLNLGDVQQSS